VPWALAKEEVPHEVLAAAHVNHLEFGKDYIIPKPMDTRLCRRVATAVAQAAIDSGASKMSCLPVNYLAELPA